MPARARQAAHDHERAADVEQELQAFSYIVSHDVAASLRHVSEFSRLLLNEFGDDLSDRQKLFADHIRAANIKCQAMLEQLLVFSRMQQKVLNPVQQDAAAAMHLALLNLSSEVRAADAEITVEPLGEVYADPALLSQAIQHLLDNAIKFRHPGVNPRISVRAAHDKKFWRARIGDNGIGVAPASREKAFWMFQRLNGEDAYPGIGAGLAICRRIARRHGGDVVFLDCDQGACVELTLPRPGSLGQA